MANSDHALMFGVVSALVAVLLAGCQGDPEPKFDPDAGLSSGSDSVSVSPAESAPAKPLNPVQTVRTWVAAQNDLMSTGEVEPLYELSTKDCSTCRGLVDGVVEVYDRGGRIEGGHWRVDLAEKEPDWKTSHEVGTAVTFRAGRSWAHKNARPRLFESEKNVMIFTLRKLDGAWLVSSVIFLA